MQKSFNDSDIKVDILEKSRQHIKFALSNCDLAFANSLRRIMISETPTMAIELVKIYNNTSVLSDNYLAHRLGLIPLISSRVNEYKFIHECECKAEDKCSKCRVFFRLNAHCYDEHLDITTSDLECLDPTCSVKPVVFHSVKGEEVGILLAKMKKNQEIEIECEARKGIGKFHAKWSPVAVANFIHEPTIKLNEALQEWNPKQKKEFVDSCPTKVYGLNEITNKIFVDKEKDCMFCNECYNKAESFGQSDTSNPVKITRSKDRFVFTVETTGVLTPEDIVLSALNVLYDKLKNIKENIPSETR